MPRPRLLFVSYALCIAQAQLVAQTADVGYVVQVKEVGELVGCSRGEHVAPIEAVSVIRQTRVFHPGTGSRSIVQVRDSVAVRQNAVAQVRIDSPVGWHGFFYLSPRALDCAVLRDTIVPAVSPDLGTYYLDQSARGNSRALTLVVLDGSAVVDWRKGGAPVVIRWGNHEAVVTGTKVALGFNQSTDRSWFYVRDGTAVVDGSAAVLGDLFVFNRGGVSTHAPRDGPQFNEDIDFYSREVFRPVFWKRPIYYVPTAVAVTGAIILIIRNNCCHNAEGELSVLGLRIPW